MNIRNKFGTGDIHSYIGKGLQTNYLEKLIFQWKMAKNNR